MGRTRSFYSIQDKYGSQCFEPVILNVILIPPCMCITRVIVIGIGCTTSCNYSCSSSRLNQHSATKHKAVDKFIRNPHNWWLGILMLFMYTYTCSSDKPVVNVKATAVDVQYSFRKTPLWSRIQHRKSRNRIGHLTLWTLSSFAGRHRPVGKFARI